MNNLESHSKRINKNFAFSYGISSLHAWIRCFECLLHIAYRLNLKVWRVEKENKEEFKRRKKELQDKFRTLMGLLIDIPKSGGSGTSNDGNTARRFFANPALSASITGLDEGLIRRFAVILNTLACGYKVNADLFDAYAFDTAKLYVKLYSWYKMPPSVHKILIHGGRILKEAIVPIGMDTYC